MQPKYGHPQTTSKPTEIMKIQPVNFLTIGLLLLSLTGFAQDKNFYIFLCFGQSNMEGNAKI